MATDRRYLHRVNKALGRPANQLQDCVELNGRLWANDPNGQLIEYMAVDIPKMSNLIHELKRKGGNGV